MERHSAQIKKVPQKMSLCHSICLDILLRLTVPCRPVLLQLSQLQLATERGNLRGVVSEEGKGQSAEGPPPSCWGSSNSISNGSMVRAAQTKAKQVVQSLGPGGDLCIDSCWIAEQCMAWTDQQWKKRVQYIQGFTIYEPSNQAAVSVVHVRPHPASCDCLDDGNISNAAGS
ncbi:unnamed protein product [Symbiodinium natans]|uniref:Uncharacterized protein n=1 Tax=Symbiodinium natans TaxID=878477 RepID=A0A812JP18_9DINO|nr:unnamed protein product [Symbiodinium natans]